MSYWLHSKSSIAEWQRYIRSQSTKALDTGSLWSLAILSFLAVFREGTETVLFFIGMASSIKISSLLIGITLGACITLPLGAKLSDRILCKTGNLRLARTGLPIIALLLTAICFSFIPAMDNYIAVLALMSLGNAFAFLPSSLFCAIIVDTAPAHSGTYSGIMHFIANIATILAPTLTGYLVVSYGYPSMFIVAAILAAIAMGVIKKLRLIAMGLIQ